MARLGNGVIGPIDERLSHHEGRKGHEGFDNFGSKLRALRVLRGKNLHFFFGCGSAALASVEYIFTLNADEPYLEISS